MGYQIIPDNIKIYVPPTGYEGAVVTFTQVLAGLADEENIISDNFNKNNLSYVYDPNDASAWISLSINNASGNSSEDNYRGILWISAVSNSSGSARNCKIYLKYDNVLSDNYINIILETEIPSGDTGTYYWFKMTYTNTIKQILEGSNGYTQAPYMLIAAGTSFINLSLFLLTDNTMSNYNKSPYLIKNGVTEAESTPYVLDISYKFQVLTAACNGLIFAFKKNNLTDAIEPIVYNEQSAIYGQTFTGGLSVGNAIFANGYINTNKTFYDQTFSSIADLYLYILFGNRTYDSARLDYTYTFYYRVCTDVVMGSASTDPKNPTIMSLK